MYQTSRGPVCRLLGGSWQPLGAVLWDLGWSRGDLGVISGHLGKHLGGPVVPSISGARLYQTSWGPSCTKRLGTAVVSNIRRPSCTNISGAQLYQTFRGPGCTTCLGGAVVPALLGRPCDNCLPFPTTGPSWVGLVTTQEKLITSHCNFTQLHTTCPNTTLGGSIATGASWVALGRPLAVLKGQTRIL